VGITDKPVKFNRQFHCQIKSKTLNFKGGIMSQPALCWLKVCYDVDKHVSLSSLDSYRLAIGYFPVENERGVEGYPIVVSLGITVCYSVLGFLYEKSALSWLAGHWGRLQPRSPLELCSRPGM